MNKSVWLYGVLLGVLVLVLNMLEYRWLVRDHSWQASVALVAILFMGMGYWVSQRLNRTDQSQSADINQAAIDALGLSPKELEVLQQLAAGLSNQQIADALFVSVNTVKTHLKNGFVKLEVTSRTQAVNKLKDLRIVP